MGRSVLDELEWLALVAIVEDDQSDPRVATQVTQRLADSTVVAVAGKASIDPPCSTQLDRDPAGRAQPSGISFSIQSVTEACRGFQPSSARARRARTRLFEPKE